MDGAASCAPGRAGALVRTGLTALLWLLVAFGVGVFSFFYLVTPTRWFNVYNKELIEFRSTLVLPYNFKLNSTTGRTTPILSGTISFLLLWQWCATLLAALATVGLWWLANTKGWLAARGAHATASKDATTAANRPHGVLATTWRAIRKACTCTRRVLTRPCPPSKLWRAVTGDNLSILDVLLILFWVGIHIMWMHEMIMRTLDNRRAEPPPPLARATAPANRPPPALAVPSSLLAAAAGSDPVAAERGSSRAMSAPGNGTQSPVMRPPSPARAPRRPRPLPEVVQNGVAKYTGWVGRLDIMLMFFPLARCNFLAWMVGSDFPELVKYHRWLGHGALITNTVHGVVYLAIWGVRGEMSHELTWDMTGGVNNVAGLVSLAGGWLLWVTCISWVRRRLFNLFYSTHILGAIVFMLFGFMHRKDVATWVMPGVILYLLDVCLRSVQQWFNATEVGVANGAATLSANGALLTLAIDCEQSMGDWVGTDIVFLNVPSVSWWQWHPFTVAAAAEPAGPGGPRQLVVHMKKYNAWTKRFLERLAADESSVRMYVSGPYHSANRQWMKGFDRVVFIAGGVGVTPALGMLHELVAQRRAAEDAVTAAGATSPGAAPAFFAGPQRASLVFVARGEEELGIVGGDIMREATSGYGGKGGASWLDVQLYATGKKAAAADIDKALPSPKAVARSPSLSTTSSLGSGSNGERALSGGRNDSPVLASGSNSGSSSTAARRRLAHPYMTGPGMWAIAVVLAFGGAFAGLCVSQIYDATMARTTRSRTDYSYVGMLQFAAFGILIALPVMALALGLHTWIAIRRRRSGPSPLSPAPSAKHAEPLPLPLPAAPGAKALAAVDAEAHAAHVPIVAGRPDVAALLARVAEEAGVGAGSDDAARCQPLRVGVFVAGPAVLVEGVLDTCAATNGLWGGRDGRAFLEVKALTHEL